MSDSELRQALSDKGLPPAEQQPGVSHAIALLSQDNLAVSEDGVIGLSDETDLELKPLSELYVEAKSPAGDKEQEALMMAIEYAIAFYDHAHEHGLRDDEAIRLLEKLSMKPEVALSGVGGFVQTYLRLELSLGDYSRADVRQALRRIQKTATRHSKGDPRGYLNHIHHFVH